MTDFEEFKAACANGDVTTVKLFLRNKNFCATQDNNAALRTAVKFKQYRVIDALLKDTAVRTFEINNDFPTLRAAMEFTDNDPLLDVPYSIARDYLRLELHGTQLHSELVKKRIELQKAYSLLEDLFMHACVTNHYESINAFFMLYPEFDPTFRNFSVLISYVELNFAGTVMALLRHPKVLALESQDFESQSQSFPAIHAAIRAKNTGIALMMVEFLRESNPQNPKFLAALNRIADSINKKIALVGSVKQGDTNEYTSEDVYINNDGVSERSSVSSRSSMIFSDRGAGARRRSFNATQEDPLVLAIDNVPTVAAPRRRWFSFSCTRG